MDLIVLVSLSFLLFLMQGQFQKLSPAAGKLCESLAESQRPPFLSDLAVDLPGQGCLDPIRSSNLYDAVTVPLNNDRLGRDHALKHPSRTEQEVLPEEHDAHYECVAYNRLHNLMISLETPTLNAGIYIATWHHSAANRTAWL